MAAQRKMIAQRPPKKKSAATARPVIPPVVLTFDQARAALKYSEHGLRKIIREGRLTVIREGRLIRVPVWAIEEYTRRQAAASMAS